jgi:hypothetical protein
VKTVKNRVPRSLLRGSLVEYDRVRSVLNGVVAQWHSLSREEQAKYYEKARQERQLHMQLYPGWSARDNYGYGTKKKKRKKERTPVESGGNSMKKCRARYGLDQQNQWCKPCSSHGGGTSTVHAGLLHAAGGAATTQSPQEPTYVNL